MCSSDLFAHVRVIRQRRHQRHRTRGNRVDAFGNHLTGINQQARGDAFVQAVTLQVAGTVCDLHQLGGVVDVDA